MKIRAIKLLQTNWVNPDSRFLAYNEKTAEDGFSGFFISV
ncbi:hypothetical protein GCHA_1989 [Paraglaciecola chathamensis S18K6]|uniref:Uncharacterized protein n=1 Tax=Paraglaciecola chathamensis S18K6 TaxID=1127672 RepID=A0AAV3UZF8_9ALTE|nr:hypothetical protein GCHA_1989 [Paraglaciecola chathamensis S18K6]